MVFNGFDFRQRLQIAGQAYFNADAFAGDVIRQGIDVALFVFYLFIFNHRGRKQMRAVAQAVGVTVGNSLENRFGAVRFAGVHGFADKMFVHVAVSVQVVGGRIAGFFAGEVKPHDGQFFLFSQLYHHFRQFQRRDAENFAFVRLRKRLNQRGIVRRHKLIEVAHRARDDAKMKFQIFVFFNGGGSVMLFFRALQPAHHGAHSVLRGQLVAGVQLRRKAHFQVAYAFGHGVLPQLIGHALNIFRALHHRAGIRKAL